MATTEQTVAALSGRSMDEGEAKRLAQQQRARRERQKQALNLQKENILSQRTSSPARRAALESALADIEAQIAKLD